MEKQLLSSFFIRFNNFVDSRKNLDYISLSEAIKIKQSAKNIINIDNIHLIFNLKTSQVYNAFRKAL